MYLLETGVRQDWDEMTQRIALTNTRMWRICQSLIVVVGLIVFLLSLYVRRPWLDLLQIGLVAALLYGVSLWIIYQSAGRPALEWLLGSLAVAGAAIVGVYALPHLESGSETVSAVWSFHWSLIVPLFGGFALLHAYWKAPDRLRQFVGTLKGWRVNASLGAALGGALSFHFLLTASFLRGVETYRPVVWSYLLWTLCYQAGLRALGEELLFRGVAFSLLFDEARRSFVRGVLQIAVLDLIAYASFVTRTPNLPLGILLLVYRVALIFLNVFLRSRQNSLIPGWVSNVIFSVAVAVVMQ